MILHIVKSGETVRTIADNYQCEINDITSNNLHITDFKNLKAGMKLKIPMLSKPIMDILEETESFISDYYPNLSEQIKDEFVKKSEEFNAVKEDVIIDEPLIEDPKPKFLDDEFNVEKEVKDVLPKAKVIEKELQSKYLGNVMPNIPSEFIRKI